MNDREASMQRHPAGKGSNTTFIMPCGLQRVSDGTHTYSHLGATVISGFVHLAWHVEEECPGEPPEQERL